MEIRAFAERVLFGDRLEDKLFDPGSISLLTDERPGDGLGVVHLPGRPKGLELDSNRPRVAFPSLSAMERQEPRGHVLHFFANHELLALELMALALLRFPDAPAGFRRGTVGTLVDEQRHMRMYLQRMTDFGVEFGAIVVSRYFWDVISSVSQPIDFVALMGLTFEQANLDYSAFYASAFRRVGDSETASILDRVLEDEITHVGHGVTWWNRWRDHKQTEFDAFLERLPAPLTASRAKGRQHFVADARKRAGLSDAFIDQLRIYGHSRGRPPNVYWFNPNCEVETGQPDASTPKTAVAELAADLETLPSFLAGTDDLVVVRSAPAPEFLSRLVAAGLNPPEFLVTADGAPAMSAHATIGELRPWGWSPHTQRKLARLGKLSPDGPMITVDLQSPARRELISKAWAASVLRDLSADAGWPDWWTGPTAPAMVVTEPGAAQAAVGQLLQTHDTVVVKSPYSTSGRDTLRLNRVPIDGVPTAGVPTAGATLGWIERQLAKQGHLLVEPWLRNVANLSALLTVPKHGRPRLLGTTRFFTNRAGQYQGTLLGRATTGLPNSIQRWLTDSGHEPRRLMTAIERTVNLVGRRLSESGYAGPAGIDMLVEQTDDTASTVHATPYRLKPIVEVNVRFTMGHVALNLARHCAPGTTGLWLLVPIRQLQKCGYESAAAFDEAARQLAPLQTNGGLDPKWRRGVLPTNDPGVATQVQSFVVAGESWVDCQRQVETLGLEWPDITS